MDDDPEAVQDKMSSDSVADEEASVSKNPILKGNMQHETSEASISVSDTQGKNIAGIESGHDLGLQPQIVIPESGLFNINMSELTSVLHRLSDRLSDAESQLINPRWNKRMTDQATQIQDLYSLVTSLTERINALPTEGWPSSTNTLEVRIKSEERNAASDSDDDNIKGIDTHLRPTEFPENGSSDNLESAKTTGAVETSVATDSITNRMRVLEQNYAHMKDLVAKTLSMKPFELEASLIAMENRVHQLQTLVASAPSHADVQRLESLFHEQGRIAESLIDSKVRSIEVKVNTQLALDLQRNEEWRVSLNQATTDKVDTVLSKMDQINGDVNYVRGDLTQQLTTGLRDFAKAREDVDATLAAMATKHAAVQENMELVNHEMSTLRTLQSQVRTEIQKSNEARVALGDDLRGHLGEAEKRISSSMDEIQRLETEVKNAKERVQTANLKAIAVEAGLEGHENRLLGHEEFHTALHKDFTDHRIKYDIFIKDAFETLKSDCLERKRFVDNQIVRLEEERLNQQEETEKLQKGVGQNQGRIAELAGDLRENALQIGEMSARVGTLEGRADDVESRTERIKDSLCSIDEAINNTALLSSRLDAVNAKADAIAGEISECKEEAQTSTKAIIELNEKVTRSEDTLAAAKLELTESFKSRIQEDLGPIEERLMNVASQIASRASVPIESSSSPARHEQGGVMPHRSG